MPNHEEIFRIATPIFFDKLPLNALKNFSTDSVSRKAAVKAIFARNDLNSLYLQENLMQHWLESLKEPPLDMDCLNTALKRTNSSLHYKILCLLLMHQLKKVEPEIDKEELIKHISQALASNNKLQATIALQALPPVIAITQPKQDTLDIWWKNIFIINKKLFDIELQEKNIIAGHSTTDPSIKFPFHVTAEMLIKALPSIFEARQKYVKTKEFDFRSAAYLISLQSLLYKDYNLFEGAGDQVLSLLLKKLDSDALTRFIDFIEKVINQRSFSIKKNKEFNDALRTIYTYFSINTTEERQKFESVQQGRSLTVSYAFSRFFSEIILALLQLPKLSQENKDRLINTLIHNFFEMHPSVTDTCLNAILPALSPEQWHKLFTRIQEAMLDPRLNIHATHYLPGIIHSVHLTEEQFNSLTEIIINDNLGHEILHSLLSSSYCTLEQKNKLIAQAKGFFRNPDSWGLLKKVKSYLKALPQNDFDDVFKDILHYIDLGDIRAIPIFPKLLGASQLSQEQFTTLIEKLDEHFWVDDFWDSEDMSEEEKEEKNIDKILSAILQSPYLTSLDIRWFDRVWSMLQKGFAINVLPDLLDSAYLIRDKDQLAAVIKLACQTDFKNPLLDLERVLSTIIASPMLNQEQFDLLLNTILPWDLRPNNLLNIITAIFQAIRQRTPDIPFIKINKEQINALLSKAIEGIKSNAFINEQTLNDFLYDPLVITQLINEPLYFPMLIGALQEGAPARSLALANFLCYLVSSGKIAITQPGFHIEHSLLKLVLTVKKPCDKSQQLMQNDKENRNSTLNTNTLFGHKRPLLEANNGEDSSPSHPGKKQGRG